MESTSHYFLTNDGAELHYTVTGEGPPLVLIPGAGFSAEVFKYQIAYFSQWFQVFSLDKRGHGKSAKVNYGYRLARFAKDLKEFMELLNAKEVTVIAHSLGAAMIYQYIDLFGTQPISRLIVVDEPAALLINPYWSASEKMQYGAIYDAATLHELTHQFNTSQGVEFKQQVVDSMTTEFATDEQKKFILDCMQIEGTAAELLFFNNICQDLRDILPRLDMPTLFIAGKNSNLPWQSHQWMSQQVHDGQVYIFEASEGGDHFVFVENADKFNQVAGDFLGI